MSERNEYDPWVCDCCGEIFSSEVDLEAHLFNSTCEKELRERYKEDEPTQPQGDRDE